MNFLPTNHTSWIFIMLMIFGLFVMKGCSESSTNADPKKEEKKEEEIIDRVSGVMYFWGKRITTTYSDWPIPEDDKPTVDSSYIDFIIALKLDSEETDRVRIYGLEGADVGKFDDMVYPNCSDSDDCKVFGRMTGVENFEVDLKNEGRTYKATGKAQTVDFKLDGEYQYQNVTITYDLFGERLIK